MLAELDAVERAQTKVAAKLRQRALKNPGAGSAIEAASQQVQAKLELAAETMRHRLLVDDAILSSRGVTPWESAVG